MPVDISNEINILEDASITNGEPVRDAIIEALRKMEAALTPPQE